MRSELLGGSDAVPRVEFRLPLHRPSNRAATWQAPQHETQSLLETLHRATETSGRMLLRARVGIGTIASEEVVERELERERGRERLGVDYPQAQTRSHLPTPTSS